MNDRDFCFILISIMAGVDDNIAMFGDWAVSNPSPRTFFANLIGDNILSENGTEVPLLESEKHKGNVDSMVKDEEFEFGIANDPYNNGCDALETPKQKSDPFTNRSNVLDIPKPKSGSGLAQRVAAKAGFNALKINTSRAGSGSLSSASSDACSSFVTIPPGLSPTTLLDSPVFLCNNLVQPSPTTGTFPLMHCPNPSSATTGNKVSTFVDGTSESFAFKPHPETAASLKMDSTAGSQSRMLVSEVSARQNCLNQSGSLLTGESDLKNMRAFELQPVITEIPEMKIPASIYQFNQNVPKSGTGNENRRPNELDDKEPNGDSAAAASEQQSEDGYNWRKYGQKQVKGSEHPRSYYKCTHPNCEVKKKVERTPEGRVTEIIYKGNHIHPKPPPNRRSPSAFYAFGETQVDGLETFDPQTNNESKPTWANPQNETTGNDWRTDGMDASSSVSAAAEFCHPSVSLNTHDDLRYEPMDTVDVSSTMSNEEDEQATLQSVSVAVDVDDDELESKRRKMDNSLMESTTASRSVNREPRVVVQTTSEVDILDDGYRWRKYGQKVVKGNPNPRSYYKCTSAGCPVRKHVERASHDLKSVITTYEGKHNHEVPAARNSGGHSNSNSTGMGGPSIPQSHAVSKRPEHTQVPDGYPRFDLLPTASSFAIHRNDQPGPAPGLSFGLGPPGLANLPMARFGPAIHARAMPPSHSYFGRRMSNEAASVIPKDEQKEEPMSGSAIPMPDNNTSVYQQFMGGLTLGPQM